MQQQAGRGRRRRRSGRSMPHVAAATVGLVPRPIDATTTWVTESPSYTLLAAHATLPSPFHFTSPLCSTLCRGQTFWNCNFRLDFKVASAPYFACSSAPPLLLVSSFASTAPLLLFVPWQHLPSATCCGGRLQVARADRRGWVWRVRGEERKEQTELAHAASVSIYVFAPRLQSQHKCSTP